MAAKSTVTVEPVVNANGNDNVTNETVEFTITDSNGNEAGSTTTTPKRGRGRPRKDGSSTAPSKERKETTAKKNLTTQKDAQELATFVLGAFQVTTAELLKKDTSFTKQEQSFIEPPLVRMLQKMDISTVERYSGIIDPIMLIGGLLLWSQRVMKKDDNRTNSNGGKVTHSNQNGSGGIHQSTI